MIISTADPIPVRGLNCRAIKKSLFFFEGFRNFRVRNTDAYKITPAQSRKQFAKMNDFELLSWSLDFFRIPCTSIVLPFTHLIWVHNPEASLARFWVPERGGTLLLPSTGFDQHLQIPRATYLFDGVNEIKKPFHQTKTLSTFRWTNMASPKMDHVQMYFL